MDGRPLRRSAIHRPPPALQPKEVVLEGRTIIDIRGEDAYHAGHIEGSLHVPDANTARLLEAISLDARAVLVCDNGRMSADIVRMMGVCGFPEVAHLDGGFQAWAKAKLPMVETTPHGERPLVAAHGRDVESLGARVLGTLTLQVFYAGLAGAALVLASVSMLLSD